MDLQRAFLLRHASIYDYYLKFFYDTLSEAQLKARPHEAANSVIWCLWHAARGEDIGLNRLVTDGTQVAEEGGWLERMKTPIRHFGIGMSGEEVSALSQQIGLPALVAYHRAVGQRTAEIVEGLDSASLDDVLEATHLNRVLRDEGAVREAEVGSVMRIYQGMTRGWFLMHLGLTHTFRHIGEATTVASLMGLRGV